ncbi:hypothetical protein CDD82_1242 [Ophiocordyceps australis]|uniref:Galactose oxidase n=1 Tax=Ophiocordyceps australis TaxID=1399860 RepID=A0A2C5YSZ2_9HYPO|nr:hypothetical protein CDD82_1242 [Ophiocordyceps australis]
MAGLLALTALASRLASGHSYPYLPTQMLMPSACLNQERCYAPDLAFVFSSVDGDTPRLLAFNLSAKIEADTRPHVVTPELPFVRDKGPTAAFGAARAADGSLIVHAGECDGPGPGEVWTYGVSSDGEACWTKAETTGGKPGEDGARTPYFLGGTLAFSSTLEPAVDRPSIYTYGGVCGAPQANDADSNGWRAQANYTKSMVSMAPHDKGQYGLRVASMAGPRVPLAGFTLTPLSASITNVSGVVSQQASAVLVGGNTQQAFINMSTAAIWSLPAEAWSFVRIQSPEPAIDSRSGHTAVLREDGKALVVLGGWVGQASTPADPQLAVLEMSQTYSSWRWAIPPAAAQPKGPGIYGHGAARLPGNIMMVYGGWQTAAPGSKTKRQAADASPRFLNMTSMEWMPGYENVDFKLHDDGGYQHNATPHHGDAAPAAEDASQNNRRLGLGVGLGLGLSIVVTVIIGLLAWRFRRRKHHKIRDDAIRDMADDANAEKADQQGFQWHGRDWRGGDHRPHLPRSEPISAYEQLRGSTIAKKPAVRSNRGEARFNAAAPLSSVPKAGIHPILEDDEGEEDRASSHHYRRQDGEVPQTPPSEHHSDPFLTPVSRLPQPAHTADQDVQNWVADVDAGDALVSRCLLGSPIRRNSTGVRDDLGRGGMRSRGGLNRSSTTAGYIRAGHLAAPELAKPESSSGSSYDTAQSALQTETPSLALSGRSPPLGPLRGGHFGEPADDEHLSTSPPKSKSSSVRRSWLGSLRHVFSSSGPSSPISAATAPDEPLGDGPSFEQLSPDAADEAAHAQVGELLRRKQGPQDWQGPGPAEESDEWDVEKAAEQRLVQVMFTVPRERLRVVNGDDELNRVASSDGGLNARRRVSNHDDEISAALPTSHLQPPDDADNSHRLSHTSHSTDDTSKRWSGAVYTAEAVTFERPRRTRVLEMVESIELRGSAPSSPSLSTSTP